MQTIALYTTETMVDWEYAYLTTQITTAEEVRPGRFRLLLVGDGPAPVRSLGGLPLSPAADLDELIPLADEGTLAALVIPGGNHYVEGGHERLAGTVEGLIAREVPVAAICGATYFLARNGFLDERRHTSNAAEFLAASGYQGAGGYVDAPVITDQGVTTASGIGGLHECFVMAGIAGQVELLPCRDDRLRCKLGDPHDLSGERDCVNA